MTELQMGLIGLGAVAVVGVLAYNKWQERQHRKVAERVFGQQHEDVLLQQTPGIGNAPRIEPSHYAEQAQGGLRSEPMFVHDDEPALHQEPRFSTEPGFASDEEEDFTPSPEPAPLPVEEVAMVAASFPAVSASAALVPPSLFQTLSDELPDVPIPAILISDRVDFIVAMELVEPVSAAQFQLVDREALAQLGKPVLWIGFNETSGSWERIVDDALHGYRRLRFALQLADRRGPLAGADLSRFCTTVRDIADELMAVADMPSSHAVLDRAIALDRFCADVDLQISVNVVSRGTPFPGTKIRALAEAAGMVLTPSGTYLSIDDKGRAQFALHNAETTPFSAETLRGIATQGLTFLFDVPRIAQGDGVFRRMQAIARQFAEVLQGTLVDDNRQPLADAQLDQIRQQYVVKAQSDMAAQGIPAGGPLALRLFA
jgi:FtsZ-interacting cell division protein ZipA